MMKHHILYFSLNVRRIRSRRMALAVYVAHLGNMINAYKTDIGKPEGRRPLRRPRLRFEDT
jgi:hypothetical protein